MKRSAAVGIVTALCLSACASKAPGPVGAAASPAPTSEAPPPADSGALPSATRCDRGDLTACAEIAHARVLTIQASERESGARDLEALCDRGLAIACAYAGDVLWVTNRTGAKARYERGCVLGAPLGCASLGVALDNESPGVARAHELLLKACDAGSPEGCTWLATTMRPKEWKEPELGEYWALVTRGCLGKVAIACRLLGSREQDGNGIPRDSVAAAEHFHTACDGHDGEGCWRWGNALERGVGTTRDERSSARAFGVSCDEGYGDGCYRLAVAYRDGLGVTADVVHASELLTAACHTGHHTSCVRLAEDAKLEPSHEKRLQSVEAVCTEGVLIACQALGETLRWLDDQEGPRAQVVLDRSCTAKLENACFHAYLAATAKARKNKTKGTVRKALDFLERGCDGASASNECVTLAEQLVSGELVPKNAKRGAALAQSLCASHGVGCKTAGEAWEKGLGVKADATKAADAYRRGCEAKSPEPCRQLARLKRTGTGTEKNVKEATELEALADDLTE